jgi:hypothetical protein
MITFLQSATSPARHVAMPTADAIACISTGTWRDEITYLRTLSIDDYRIAKKQLPAFAFGGTFKPELPAINDNLLQASGLFHFDIDHVTDIFETRIKLIALPELVFCFISPSGTGLKGALRIDASIVSNPIAYNNAFTICSAYLAERGIIIDPACRDIRRLCFVSYDPELYYNPDAIIFHIDTVARIPVPPRMVNLSSLSNVRSRLTLDNIEDLRAALRHISPDELHDWHRVALLLSQSGEDGFRLWAEWSATGICRDSSNSKFGQRWALSEQELREVWTARSHGSGAWRDIFITAESNGWENPGRAQRGVLLTETSAGQTEHSGAIPINRAIDPFGGVVEWPHMDHKRKPYPTPENLRFLLEQYNIKCYQDVITNNQIVTFNDQVIGGSDGDESSYYQIAALIALNNAPVTMINNLAIIFNENERNPVLDWITETPWDGVNRIADMCNTVFVEDEDVYYRDKALRMWFTQCIAALDMAEHTPIQHAFGKYESMLVFQSPGGYRKTTWLSSLLPQDKRNYIISGIHLDVDNKDSVVKATAAWLCELGELDGTLNKNEISRLKAFLSDTVDIIRLPYARTQSKRRRHTSFFASVNDARFLSDRTGNRRFLPLQITAINYSHNIDLQQFWAEIWAGYLAGAEWWPDAELDALMVGTHAKHLEDHPVEQAIHSHFDLALSYGRKDGVNYQTGTKLPFYNMTQMLSACAMDRPTKHDYKVLRQMLTLAIGDSLCHDGYYGWHLSKRMMLPGGVIFGDTN